MWFSFTSTVGGKEADTKVFEGMKQTPLFTDEDGAEQKGDEKLTGWF